jgi:hypothetical protein
MMPVSRNEGGQEIGRLAEHGLGTREFGAYREIVGHLGGQGFVRHHDHRVHQLEQDIHAEVVPEPETLQPHQRIHQHSRDADQDEKPPPPEFSTQARVVEVVADIPDDRVADGVDDVGDGEDRGRLDDRQAAEGRVEIEQPCRRDRQRAAAQQVGTAIAQRVPHRDGSAHDLAVSCLKWNLVPFFVAYGSDNQYPMSRRAGTCREPEGGHRCGTGRNTRFPRG